MSLVGKKFPSIEVDAISEMGDNMKINIFEEAKKNNKSFIILVSKRLLSYALLNCTLFKLLLPEFQRNTIVIGASDTNEVHFAWLNTPK
jgi:peroxiredoxin (alkyl hydroperoxide reductase subunit C)